MNPTKLYLDLLKKCLTRYIFINEQPLWGYTIDHIKNLRENGGDWPPTAETMIGLKRLNNIQYCIEHVLKFNTPGDLIETGVWRGGSCIFMAGCLKAYADDERKVWVADCFEGVPKPEIPQDQDNTLWMAKDFLAVDVVTVKQNFEKYGLLNDNIKFLHGYFKDTLPNVPIEKLAILRLDGDLYQSTIEALNNLYSKLSVGGFCIIDDYCLANCKIAVDDFRRDHGIDDPLIAIDEMKKGDKFYLMRCKQDRPDLNRSGPVSYSVTSSSLEYVKMRIEGWKKKGCFDIEIDEFEYVGKLLIKDAQ